MIIKYQNKKLLLLLTLDIILVSLSIVLSFLLRFDLSFPDHVYLIFNPLNISTLICIKIGSFKIFGLYRGMWRYTSVWDMINIIKASSLSSFLLILIVYYSNGFQFIPRSIFFIDYIICTGIVSISRLGIRMFFTHFLEFIRGKKEKNLRKKILIIGAGDTGNIILRQTIQMPKSLISVVGFLDDDPSKIGARLNDVPVLARIDEINNLNINFDEIYICIPW
jgi:FlaA1/EpsC-like NDP-sugar epimerase